MDYIAILFFVLLVVLALLFARIMQLGLLMPIRGGDDDLDFDDEVEGGYEMYDGGAEEGERRPFVFGIAPEFYKYIPVSEKNKPKKTIDIRKGNESSYQELLKNKSKMGYRNRETHQMAICDLKDLRHYKSIADLVAKEKPETYSPELKSAADFRKAIEQYYNDETVEKAGGLVVFEFAFLNTVDSNKPAGDAGGKAGGKKKASKD